MSDSVEECDVLIVGGGPAGLACAVALAPYGLRVVLCERGTWPQSRKVCGEGLMPTGLALLQKLGVNIPPTESHPFVGICYRTEGGTVLRGEFAGGPGLGIPRRVLSQALIQRVRALGAAELREHSPCTELNFTASGWQARCGERTLRPRVLVGADGPNSLVRRAGGLDRPPGPRAVLRWGARWHFPVAPWTEGFVDVLFSHAGVEAYITPVGPRETGVAFVWDRDRFQPAHGGARLCESLLAVFPSLAARLRGVAPRSDDGGAVGPLLRHARAQTAPGLALLGDAAGYLDAITGEGLSLAFEEAVVLAEHLGPALQSAGRRDGELDPARSSALRGYQRQYRRLVKNYYRVTGLVLALAARPALCEDVVAALVPRPRLFRHMLAVNMGARSLFRPPPGAALGFAYDLARRVLTRIIARARE